MSRVFRRKAWKELPAGAEVRADKNGKRFARWSVRGRLHKREISECGARYLWEAKTYTVEYTPATGGQSIRLPTKYTDKSCAENYLRSLDQDEEDKRRGVYDNGKGRAANAQQQPIESHIADFIQGLKDQARTGQYIKTTETRIRRLIDAAGVIALADMQISSVNRGLAVTCETHTLSDQSRQHYVRAIVTFARWLEVDGRVAVNPIQHLKAGPVVERVRERRILSVTEFNWLLQTTSTRTRPNQKVSGPDRAMFYLLMAVTGFRLQEAASLTRENFTEDSGELVVNLAAKSAKNRRRDRKVIPAGQASRARNWLASKAPGELLFPLPSKFSKSLRRDMAAAREAWIDDGVDATDRKEREANDFCRYVNSAGLFADNHSFRALYCTMALRVSGNEQAILAASRHSNIEVARRYWHPAQDEFAALQHRIGEQLQPPPSSPANASHDARQCAVQCADDEALLRIIEAWPVLPETVRQAIGHLVSGSLTERVAGQQPSALPPSGRAKP